VTPRVADALHGLTASRRELEADEERRISHVPGATPVAEVVPRRRAVVAGTVTALTYRPRTQTPALAARLSDGTGSLEVIFLGRREVPGITPGRRLVAEGMVYDDHGRPAMFNPAYRLLPRGASA
jgi:DNA/RNA endonuclease YhcR with UshA esterase domain